MSDLPEPSKRKGLTWRRGFLAALEQTGTVLAATRAVGIDLSTAYKARKRSEEFAQEWNDALERATEHLEAEALRRAMKGSDTLLIFLLKGARPHKYRDNYTVPRDADESAKAPIISLVDRYRDAG